MHADVDEPGLDQLLVERVQQLLVVHAPRVARQLLVGIVAHRVALERVGLELVDRAVDVVHPARHPRHEDRVGEHALAAGEAIHLGARLGLHLVREEPVARLLGARARDQRDLGVAVEEHLLEVVRELEILQGLGLARERGVPPRLAHRLARAHEALEARVVAQEVRVHVHDELIRQPLRALVRQLGRRGLGPARAEDRSIDVVHGDEGRRHARRRLEEAPSAHPLALGERVAQLLDAPLHLFLSRRLGQRRELVARDELGRDGRGERGGLGGQERCQVFRIEQAHRGVLLCRGGGIGPHCGPGRAGLSNPIPVGYTPRHERARLHRLRHDRAGRRRPRRGAGHHPGRAADLVPRAPAASGRPGGRPGRGSESARASGSVSSPRTMPPTWTSTAPARARASSPTRSTGDSPPRKWSGCWSAPRPR